MNREEMLGPAVSPETGEAYEQGTGYKGVGIGAGIVVLLAMKMCHSVFTAGPGSEHPSTMDLPSQIAAAVADARRQLPVRVDDVTTMTGISSTGRRIIYDMRLEGDIPSEDVPAARAEQQAAIERVACADAASRRMLDAGASLASRYTDESGDSFEIEVRSCSRR